MEPKKIAATDIAITPIALGTVKLGRNQGVKYPQAFDLPTDSEARQLLNTARDLGINCLDTAPAYGSSEERLGQLLGPDRKHWVLCTKVGENFHDGESSFDFTPEAVQASIARSLKRLNTDFLDIVLVHSDGNDCDIIERYGILEVLADLKRAGVIGATGMSTKTVEGGIAAAQRSDMVMATYNPEYPDETPVLDYCQENNIGVLVKKALASGHLCLNAGDPVEEAMAFIFSHPGVTSVVTGTLNPQHLRHNVAAVCKALGG